MLPVHTKVTWKRSSASTREYLAQFLDRGGRPRRRTTLGLGPVTPLDEDRGDAEPACTVDVVLAVADHHHTGGAARFGILRIDPESGEAVRDDLPLVPPGAVVARTTDELEVSGQTEVVEDPLGERLGLRRRDRQATTCLPDASSTASMPSKTAFSAQPVAE